MDVIYVSDDPSIVIDTNVYLDLIELGHPELLFGVFGEVKVPRLMYEKEYDDAMKETLRTFAYSVVDLTTDEGYNSYNYLRNQKKYRNLSENDRFGIAAAKEHACYMGSNEKLVRTACKDLDIPHTGVLGVLGRAYIKELVTHSDLVGLTDLLQSEQTTCHITKEVIEEFLEEIVREDLKE